MIDNLLAAFQHYYPEHTFVELRPAYVPLSVTSNTPLRKLFNHLQRLYWTQIELPWQATRRKCNLLFCTCLFNPYVQPLPTVTLFHDLAIWRYPEWYPRWWITINKLFAEFPARYNPHIITVSEDGRQDVIKFFARQPEQVTAIHLGLDLPQCSSSIDRDVLRRYDLSPEDEYIFHLGIAVTHKNLPNLVRAFAQVCRQLPDRKLKLVLAGPGSNLHGRDELNVIRSVIHEQNVVDRVVFPGFVPREHCTVLYRNATVYAFPSLFEGFGLPMVEAMACGTPVVASRLTSLPEIGGDAAIYFDPYNPEAIAHALILVLTQPALRAEMIRRGHARAGQFTWRRAADEYVRLFEQIAAGQHYVSQTTLSR